jgi:hypothetical protein
MIKINEQNQLEIYNVVPVYRGNRIIKFLTSVSVADIIKIKDRVKYDVQTQRGQRVRNNKLENIMSKKNIDEMKFKMLDNFFDGGTLCWNVRLPEVGREKEVVNFDIEEDRIIVLSQEITLPDSYQRHNAIWDLEAYNFSIDQYNYNFPLSICLYTLAEEQNLFSEINGCGSKACKTRTLYLNNAHKNILVKDIIKNSGLKNNVEVVQDSIFRKDKVVAFATLYSSWFDKTNGAFKTLQEEQSKEFKDWIIRFYNYLIEIRPELGYMDAKERYELSKKSIAFSTHVWFAYANIAKLLQGDQNWKRKLQRLNKPYKSGQWEGDIFSFENPIWHGTISVQNKIGEWKLVNNKTSHQFCTDIAIRFLNL